MNESEAASVAHLRDPRSAVSGGEQVSVLDGPGEGTWSVFAMRVVEERDRMRERVSELEGQLEDADLVMRDALGHANAAKEGWQTEYLRLDRDLDKIALALGVAGIGSHGAVNTRPSIERILAEIEEIKERAKRRPLKMVMPEGWNTTPGGPYEGE